MRRSDFLLEGVNRDAIGLEIGPFYAPVAPKRDGWNVVTVDYADAKRLKEIAQTYEEGKVKHLADQIEDVDIVWAGEPLDELALALHPDGYDYVVASHVAEHIPDLLRFLRSLSKIIKVDGLISLALPDLRGCYDYYQRPARTSDVLQAYREGRRLHAPEVVLAAYAYRASGDGVGAWRQGAPAEITFKHRLAEAFAIYQDYESGWTAGDRTYKDVHVWFGTPSSFHLLMVELRALGLIDLEVASLRATRDSEYLVTLQHASGSPPEGDQLEAARLKLIKMHNDEMADLGTAAEVGRLTELVANRDAYIERLLAYQSEVDQDHLLLQQSSIAYRDHIAKLEKNIQDYRAYVEGLEERLRRQIDKT